MQKEDGKRDMLHRFVSYAVLVSILADNVYFITV